MTRRTGAAWLAGVVTLALGLTGCGGDDEVSLTVWVMDPGSPAAAEALEQTARAFERQHEGVSVTIELVPWAQAYDRLVAATAGGEAPDLAESVTTWTPRLAGSGALDPIATREDLTYVASVVQAGTVADAGYGYPWYAGARALLYRTDLFAQFDLDPPGTWADVLRAGERIAATGVDPIQVGGEYQHFFVPLIWGAGGEIAIGAGGGWTATVDSDAGRAAFDFYRSLWDTGWSPPEAMGWTSLELRREFAEERSAMLVGGGWDLAAVLEANPDLTDRVGVALMPAGPAGIRATFAGGSHLVVFRGFGQTGLAHEFAQFMLSPEQVTGFTAQIGFLPGTVEGVRAATDDPRLSVFGTQLVEHSRAYPAASWWDRVEQERIFPVQMQRLLGGDQDVPETVAGVQAAIEAAIGAAPG
jgi:N,N'-diacetylchitobiose transport system substrate-binding protein